MIRLNLIQPKLTHSYKDLVMDLVSVTQNPTQLPSRAAQHLGQRFFWGAENLILSALLGCVLEVQRVRVYAFGVQMR